MIVTITNYNDNYNNSGNNNDKEENNNNGNKKTVKMRKTGRERNISQ